MTIFIQSIGEGSEQIPIWRIISHEYGIWVPGRVFVQSEADYKVG
jgi:hypothetical protein